MNIQNNSVTSDIVNSSKEDIPVLKLLAFTLAGFITIMTETIPAGLLPLISRDLQVTEALAGQLVSVYALGSVIAAIPVVAATRSWSRRPLFLLAISGLLIFNTLTALSSSYIVVLVARFIAGMSAGIIWGVLAGYARSMVSANLQGRALAIVGVGQPIALCLGVPLGTWLGSMFGWRGVFWIISLLALFLLIWIRTAIPNFSGQVAEKRQSIKEIFLHPGIRSVLAVIFLWILAHNVLYTFISPYLASVGLDNHIDRTFIIWYVINHRDLGHWCLGGSVITFINLAKFSWICNCCDLNWLRWQWELCLASTEWYRAVGYDFWRGSNFASNRNCRYCW